MWPFKNKNYCLIAYRYTLQTWRQLNIGNQDEWYDYNCPNDIMTFIKKQIILHTKHIKVKPTSMLVVTIDDDYVTWLNERKHSDKMLKQYMKDKDSSVWNEKLKKYNMDNAYNVLCIPLSIMPYQIENKKTNFTINKDSSIILSDLLRSIYQNKNVYCPGWILKGIDTPTCYDDIISVAEMYWLENKNITIGKYEEQTYNLLEIQNKFKPKIFTIPFVVKTTISSAVINLSGTYNKNDNLSHAMTFIEFGIDNVSKMINILKSNINCIITNFGKTAILPGQAYLAYTKMENIHNN